MGHVFTGSAVRQNLTQDGCLMRVIHGKKALVTGAASGIGRAIALALAREGADLYLLDVDHRGLAETAAEARRLGVTVLTARCDVSRPSDITAANREILGRWGELDILVNNAGVIYYGPTVNMTARQWDWLLSINLHAPLQFTRELLPTLLSRPEAHVLNVASMAGLVGLGRFVAYNTSKFALVGFSESLRAELGRLGLGVTALCPGFVRTNLFGSAQCGHKDRETPTPPRWISTTPDRVAAKAINAIYCDRGLVLVTPAAYLLHYAKRFAPGVIDLLSRLDRSRAMKKKAAALEAGPSIPIVVGTEQPDAAYRRAARGSRLGARAATPSPLRSHAAASESPL
jgi:NAD(P)-dependent dehydrogenase (short-subunit alcohol dehydrogenase family)